MNERVSNEQAQRELDVCGEGSIIGRYVLDLLDARAQEESWKILTNKMRAHADEQQKRAEKAERELEEAGEVIEDLKADNIRLGARLDSRTESGALEYASLHDEVMRLRAAARAAEGGGDE